MIHLYTGKGKGKTTAAVGLCIRALGQGFHVCFAQFMKGNDSGELHVLEQQPGVKILRSKKNFGFYGSMSENDKAELTEIHNQILDRILEAVEERACQMVILDEVTYPVNWDLLDMEKLKRLLAFGKEGAEGEIELVLTGRDAAGQNLTGRGKENFLREAADYLTEMECVRHPFEKGIGARKGIEF